MALIRGKSKKSSNQNDETKDGKPQDKSLAIAYDMQRRSKKAVSGKTDEKMAKYHHQKDEEVSHRDPKVGDVVPHPECMAHGGNAEFHTPHPACMMHGGQMPHDSSEVATEPTPETRKPGSTRYVNPKAGKDAFAFGGQALPDAEQGREGMHFDSITDAIMHLRRVRAMMAKGGDVGGASTSTTGNKTKTGGSNPGGASTGGAGTVTITTGAKPPQSIRVSDVGGRTDARNAGGSDPSDKDDDMMEGDAPSANRMFGGGKVKEDPVYQENMVAKPLYPEAPSRTEVGMKSIRDAANDPSRVNKADGGEITADSLDDIVDEIIRRRAHSKMMAEGGQADLRENGEETSANPDPFDLDNIYAAGDMDSLDTALMDSDPLADEDAEHDEDAGRDTVDEIMRRRKHARNK